jgi:hypothetical protein
VNTHQRIWTLLTLVAVACVALVRYGSSRRLDPVNVSQAREALQKILQCWKDGHPPDEMQKASPPVFVQDFDWLAGRQLASFEIAPDHRTDDVNLHCAVRLRIKSVGGDEVQKDVTYVVTTSPVVTVFREVMM